jgi:poly(3-hydroxybutyrate) depolymerase
VLSLTAIPLLAATVLFAAVAAPLVAWWWKRTTKTSWLSALRPLAAVLACQLVAISALFLWVNTEYGFYTSWSDLFGVRTERVTIQSNGLQTNRLVKSGGGHIQALTVAGRKVLVWLPPQYDQPEFKTTAFPVLMVLPGQPSTPDVMFRHYDFGHVATTEINAGRIRPFIAVFPPLMTDPPRDTECTNIPAGPQDYTWLSSMVPNAVRRHVRAKPGPWSLAGWSTGAFCSAKLLLTQPQDFQAPSRLAGTSTRLLTAPPAICSTVTRLPACVIRRCGCTATTALTDGNCCSSSVDRTRSPGHPTERWWQPLAAIRMCPSWHFLPVAITTATTGATCPMPSNGLTMFR